MRTSIFILILFAGIFICDLNTQAQQISSEEYSIDSVIYKHTLSGGILIHNRGFGLQVTKGKNLNASKNRFYEASLVNTKSPKQIRSINPYYPNSKSFVYGKLNEFFILRGGMGYTHVLNRKPYWGGVELRTHYSGGFSLGLAKPVYFYVNKSATTNTYETQRFEPGLYIYEVVGRAPFTRGFGEMGFHPGIFLKGGVAFEFGPVKSRINSLEMGAIVDLFINEVQLMADNNPKNVFLAFYLSYRFGKRYNIY
ncbi:MAG: hypothetical protein K9G58_09145 [Bacteroidales bacterium]|nr:hypothetical protein [Bacteroidales bacterium]MCF8387513.1 hypothetical protein [Bacteroidales bacterium]MCF8398321.1 hypothetical protein [Bacteroidales bacterium]